MCYIYQTKKCSKDLQLELNKFIAYTNGLDFELQLMAQVIWIC